MSNKLRQLFPSAEACAASLLGAFKRTLPPLEWSMWLSDLRFEREEGKTIVLSSPSPSKRDKITERYLQPLRSMLSAAHPGYEFVLADPSPKGKAIPVVSARSSVAHAFNPKQQLSDFVVVDSNRIAYDFCRKVTHHLGSVSPLYLYGNVGLGKTHLLQAIGNHYATNFPFLKVQYLDPNDFVSEFTRSLALGTDRDFRLKYKSLDLLLLDDVQFFAGKEKSALEFFHVFNAIASPHKKQMVFCSDREPSTLNHIDERLKSRLSSSAIIEIKPPSTKDLASIIRSIAANNNLNLPEDIIDFLANNAPKDLRKVTGALNTLVAFKDIYDQPITVGFCQQHLKQLRLQGPKAKLLPEALLLAIANHANLSLRALRSPNRSKTIAHYRQLAMYLLREHTSLSILEIGNALGGKASSTVSASHKKVMETLQQSPEVQHQIDCILDNT